MMIGDDVRWSDIWFMIMINDDDDDDDYNRWW